VTLETWDDPSGLYLARGDEVADHRPLFTGDVVDDIAIPGVQDHGPGIVVAHPCSMRGKNAQLLDAVLAAAVVPHDPAPPHKWLTGFYDRMPLPHLTGPGGPFHVASIEMVGRARTEHLAAATRIACLSPFGLNLLQQRMIWNLTRLDVPTRTLWDAFGYTYEEADLLEEWLEEVDAEERVTRTAAFEVWIRDGAPNTRQARLRDPQQRASVRAELRKALSGL
jgi:hypothetical protein